jgi:hypothetical protein
MYPMVQAAPEAGKHVVAENPLRIIVPQRASTPPLRPVVGLAVGKESYTQMPEPARLMV